MPRSGTKSGARVAAAAQVLGMGYVRAVSTSNALTSPFGGPSSRPCQDGCNDTFPVRSFVLAFTRLSGMYGWCRMFYAGGECISR